MDQVEQNTFVEIKQTFEEAPDLYLIQSGLKFDDASINGIKARLFQYKDDDECKWMIAYASRSLKGAEYNYSVTELEALALANIILR